MLKPTQLKIIGGITIFVAILAGLSVYFYFSNKQELTATNNVVSVPTKINQESTEQIKTIKESNSQTPVISEEEKKEREEREKKRLAENTQRFEKHMEEWDDIVANNRYAIFNRDLMNDYDLTSICKDYKLYHGEKIIMDNIYLSAKQSGFDLCSSKEGIIEGFDEWFRREKDDNIFLYIVRHGGVSSVVEYYFIINRITNTVIIKQVTNDFPLPSLSHISPNKNKIAYLKFSPSHDVEDESIWIYDLNKEESKKAFDMPKGYTIESQAPCCFLTRDLLNWVDNNTLKITSLKRELDKLSQEYQVVATSTDIVNIE